MHPAVHPWAAFALLIGLVWGLVMCIGSFAINRQYLKARIIMGGSALLATFLAGVSLLFIA